MTSRLILPAVLTAALAASPAWAQGDPPAPAPAPSHDHHQHDHGKAAPPVETLPPFIPVPSDAERAAAFPDVHGHEMRDGETHYFVLADQFEAQAGEGDTDFSWDVKGWVGTDLSRLWFRTEGEATGSELGASQTHVFYGRAVSRWWTALVGLRQDVRPTTPQTWVAVGMQGLAPYWLDVEATAYVSTGGRTHVRIETEYDLLVTNRLVLQPLLELEAYGKADPARRLGAGLSHIDAGLRLRYEVRREFAPYVGLSWNRTFFGTADARRAAGLPLGRARVVVGVRMWM